jgi:hypothetical protein
MTEEVKEHLIKITIRPEEVFESFPTDFLPDGQKPEEGFAEKILDVPITSGGEIQYEVSYDGESELLAVIKSKPIGITDEVARDLFMNFLDVVDEDEEDEEDDDEDDEDTKD